MVTDGPNVGETGRNGAKRGETGRNGAKRAETVRNGRNGPKWGETGTNRASMSQCLNVPNLWIWEMIEGDLADTRTKKIPSMSMGAEWKV